MTRHPLNTVAVFLGGVVAVANCAYGRRYAYHLANPTVEQGRAMSIALAVQDQRGSVNAGGPTDFVGVSRGSFGNSFDVTTASGQPLAADFAVSIQRGLESAGYRVTPVRVMDRARTEVVARTLAKTNAERLLAVTIDVWHSDTLNRSWLHYGVRLQVFDDGGHELGRAGVSGSDVIGSAFQDRDNLAELAMPRACAQKLERLLNDPAIKRALLPRVPSAASTDEPRDARSNGSGREP